MTAIGFVLLALGWAGLKCSDPRKLTTLDYVVTALFAFGFLLMLAGLATWLWGVLP